MTEKYPYWEWEDYQAGLYRLSWRGAGPEAMVLLRDTHRLNLAMREAVSRWPKAAAHHLTDGGMNQRAWLGWAACGVAFGVPSHITRAVWGQLTEDDRRAANAVADAVIADYGATLPLFD